MAMTAEQLAKQKKQAEELIETGEKRLGFVKTLFFGQINTDRETVLFPFPVLNAEQAQFADEGVAKLRQFCQEHIDPALIDRTSDIPATVIQGLGELGVLGLCAPKEYGGQGASQQVYGKLLEVLGSHCSSTAVFVNAHHSIGIRALVLFGTPEQQRTWLPDLVTGRKLAAFALTEPEAGSDAANVQTTATPTPDGRGFVLNGVKRYITNGGIAHVLTVMARTPVPNSDETRVTAFLVTPDMPGFEVLEVRADKCGIRGTATGKLRFTDMFVPTENVLGKVGKGLRLALTVLDYGRTTFGATCTGAAKFCVKAMIQHARHRVQFQQTLAEFELVRKKIAFAAAHAFAMDAMTTHCAALIDSGSHDYMLETAILKVFATEHLWTIINDCIQIHGGMAYFTDQPFERMMRDARINTIGEGANDVLKSFVALVGLRGVGLELLGILNALKHPLQGAGTLLGFGRDQLAFRLTTPDIPVRSASLATEARLLGKLVKEFGLAVQWLLRHAKSEERLLKNQLQQERIADVAMDLYASACVLSRLDHLTQHGNGAPAETNHDLAAGRYFLRMANRRARTLLDALSTNDDEHLRKTADALLGALE